MRQNIILSVHIHHQKLSPKGLNEKCNTPWIRTFNHYVVYLGTICQLSDRNHYFSVSFVVSCYSDILQQFFTEEKLIVRVQRNMEEDCSSYNFESVPFEKNLDKMNGKTWQRKSVALNHFGYQKKHIRGIFAHLFFFCFECLCPFVVLFYLQK